MSNVGLIEYAHRAASVPLRESGFIVSHTTGKSLAVQLREIWRLHRSFGQLTQRWDIAPSEGGPVLVEVNVGGDFALPQLGNAAGMLDDRFRACLDTHRVRPKGLPPWGFHLRARSRLHAAIDHLRRKSKSRKNAKGH